MTKRLLITVDGKQYDVLVEVLDAPATTFAPAPAALYIPPAAAPASAPAPVAAPAPVSAPAPIAPAPAGKASGPGDVPSPLSGRIVSIEVKVGQQVKEGEHVVTLEAMKMNTHVFATRSGTVAEIKVAVGDAAEEGQTLVVIT